jgi:uncharacterized sulfatase
MTGKSFLDLLLSDDSGRLDPSREFVLAAQEKASHLRDDHLGYPMRSIRTYEYRYIRNFKPERWPRNNGPAPGEDPPTDRWSIRRPAEELFNIEDDPYCLVNLAADAAYTDVLAKLRNRLEQELRGQSDPRVLGYGDIYEEFLMEIPPEILVSELYHEALQNKQAELKVGSADQ